MREFMYLHFFLLYLVVSRISTYICINTMLSINSIRLYTSIAASADLALLLLLLRRRPAADLRAIAASPWYPT